MIGTQVILLLALYVTGAAGQIRYRCPRHRFGWLRRHSSNDPLREQDCANQDYNIDFVLKENLFHTESTLGLILLPVLPNLRCPRLLFRVGVKRRTYSNDEEYSTYFLFQKNVRILDSDDQDDLDVAQANALSFVDSARRYSDIILALKRTGLTTREEQEFQNVEQEPDAVMMFRTLALLQIPTPKNATGYLVDQLMKCDLRWNDIYRAIGGNLAKRATLRLLVGRYIRKYGYDRGGRNRWLPINSTAPLIVDNHGDCPFRYGQLRSPHHRSSPMDLVDRFLHCIFGLFIVYVIVVPILIMSCVAMVMHRIAELIVFAAIQCHAVAKGLFSRFSSCWL